MTQRKKSRCRFSWLLVLVLAGLSASPGMALCLGCPPVAWQAEVTRWDGEVDRGWLVLSYFLVEEEVDFSARPEHWRGWQPKKLLMWTTVAESPQPVFGHIVSRYLPEEKPRHGEVKAPRRSILLVGEPIEIDTADIALIRDVGPAAEPLLERTRGPVFYVTSGQAAWLDERPAAALQINAGEDTDYCFWMKEVPSFKEQLELCTSQHSFTRYDVMAGGLARDEEPSVDGLIVLHAWGGT